MVEDLDKDFLRELSITAMGDIMRILKHVKNVTTKYADTKSSKSAQEKLLRPSPRRDSPPIQTSLPKTSKEKDVKMKEKKVVKEVKSSVSSRLGPQVSKHVKMEVDNEKEEKVAGEKSVFNRLGSQSNLEEKTSPNK